MSRPQFQQMHPVYQTMGVPWQTPPPHGITTGSATSPAMTATTATSTSTSTPNNIQPTGPSMYDPSYAAYPYQHPQYLQQQMYAAYSTHPYAQYAAALAVQQQQQQQQHMQQYGYTQQQQHITQHTQHPTRQHHTSQHQHHTSRPHRSSHDQTHSTASPSHGKNNKHSSHNHVHSNSSSTSTSTSTSSTTSTTSSSNSSSTTAPSTSTQSSSSTSPSPDAGPPPSSDGEATRYYLIDVSSSQTSLVSTLLPSHGFLDYAHTGEYVSEQMISATQAKQVLAEVHAAGADSARLSPYQD